MSASPSSVNMITLSGTIDAAVPLTEVRLPDGKVVLIDTQILLGQDDFDDAPVAVAQEGAVGMIPLIEESLVVGRKTVETGKVRLIKTETSYETQLNEPLAALTFDIERVVLNEPVEVTPTVRVEGDTTIYPVVEEQLILKKRLVLREEIRVTRRDTERIDTRSVTLRKEHLVVEREDLT